MRIEFVSGAPEYGEFRDRGWWVTNPETGESEGPFRHRIDAEYAAGRSDDDEGE